MNNSQLNGIPLNGSSGNSPVALFETFGLTDSYVVSTFTPPSEILESLGFTESSEELSPTGRAGKRYYHRLPIRLLGRYVSSQVTIPLGESLGFNESISNDTALALKEEIALNGITSGLKESFLSIAESLGLSDSITQASLLVLSEAIGLSQSIETISAAISEVFEGLGLSDSQGIQVLLSVLETIGLDETPEIDNSALLQETIGLTESLEDLKLNLEALVEAIGLSQIAAVSSILSGDIEESIQLNEAISGILTAFAEVSEGVIFTELLPIAEESVTVAFNTKIQGFTEYEGFTFDSVKKFNGSWYLFNKEGVFLLDDSPVDIEITTANTDFETPNLKSLERIYLGEVTPDTLDVFIDVDNKYKFQFKKSNLIEFVKLGKGIKGYRYRITLKKKGVKDFTLDTMRLLLNAFRRTQ